MERLDLRRTLDGLHMAQQEPLKAGDWIGRVWPNFAIVNPSHRAHLKIEHTDKKSNTFAT